MLLTCTDCSAKFCRGCRSLRDAKEKVCARATCTEQQLYSRLAGHNDKLLVSVARLDLSLLELFPGYSRWTSVDWIGLMRPGLQLDLSMLSDGQLGHIFQSGAAIDVFCHANVPQGSFGKLTQRQGVSGEIATAMLGICCSPKRCWQQEAVWLIERRDAVIDEAWSDRGTNPLHVAALMGMDRVVAYLLLRGASVNRRSRSGQTPLHYAASAGHLEVVKVLLGAGAIASMWDVDQRTAASLAHAGGHTAVVELMQHAPCQVQ